MNEPRQPRAILMPTCRRYARYADLGAASMDALWRDRPPLYILSDGGAFRHRDVVVSRATSWVEILADGLDALLVSERLAPEDWVVLVIEDHTAMSPIPSGALAAVAAFADAYPAPCVRLNNTERRARRYLTRIEGHLIADVDHDARVFHSLHPALWKVGYLRQRLAVARARGAVSAWQFETMPYEGTPHLAARAVWPSAFSGYLKRGRIDLDVLLAMRHPALAPLRRRLMRDWLVDTAWRGLTFGVRRALRAAWAFQSFVMGVRPWPRPSR